MSGAVCKKCGYGAPYNVDLICPECEAPIFTTKCDAEPPRPKYILCDRKNDTYPVFADDYRLKQYVRSHYDIVNFNWLVHEKHLFLIDLETCERVELQLETVVTVGGTA